MTINNGKSVESVISLAIAMVAQTPTCHEMGMMRVAKAHFFFQHVGRRTYSKLTIL
jgi:hypothetical protein